MPQLPLRISRLLYFAALTIALLVGCRSPQVTGSDITIRISADGESRNITIPAGSTVTQALQAAGITVGSQDRVAPPLYTILGDGNSVTLTRVEEVFETEQQIIPFEIR